MDQTKYHNLQSLAKSITSQFLKKVTQLLLSVSLFSLFFSNSSCYSFFLHSFKSYFSTFSFYLLSHIMDKYCIFLICNGILVFLAKTSGFIRFSPASDDPRDQLSKKIADGDGDDGFLSASEMRETFPEKEVSMETTGLPLENVVVEEEEEEYSVEGETDESNLIVEDKEQQGKIGVSTTKDEEDNEKEIDTIGFLSNEEEEEEEEEEDGLLSTEELNKKFDEFIRRMKEEIRIGAQQQLIMVQ